VTQRSTVRTLLDLGRVSNLPTVWTNCAAAVALVGAAPPWWSLLVCAIALSLFYTGGMFLNDAFDGEIDREQRPDRPIPSGAISASSVFVLGFGQLSLGIVAITTLASMQHAGHWASGAALLLSLTIVAYNLHHKENPLSPLLMGLCRVLVYATVGLLYLPGQEAPPWEVSGTTHLLSGAAVLLGYLMLLTVFAKREGRGKKPPAPIPVLIAGISLVDGLLMLSAGALLLAPVGLLGFFTTLRLQRWVRGD